MLGPAPVVDFDGTLAALPVAWDELRRHLGVARIDDLWERGDAEAWRVVDDAETSAAAVAQPVAAVLAALEKSQAVAVLSSNGERAVRAFLEREPLLSARVVRVVGREALGGPKTNFEVFARGFKACVASTATARGTEPICYVGDMEYELDFARRLGATVVDARELRVADE